MIETIIETHLKTTHSFRLDAESTAQLEQLSHKQGKTKTEVISEAIHLLAKQEKTHVNPLMKYAGIWKDLDVDAFLKDIYSSRKSKKNMGSEL